jgi:hypothetical protein
VGKGDKTRQGKTRQDYHKTKQDPIAIRDKAR